MKISIITVSYNSAETIRDTIESVLNQTYSDIEYIIVDADSTDNTVEIIREYEPKFGSRLKWVSEKDDGLYDGMNKGIKIATGDIVGIINSDDFYHRNDIIQFIANSFIENKDVQATFADIRFVNPDNLDKTVRYYASKRFKTWRLRFGFMPPHPSFFTYKHNFEKYGYYKTTYKIASDYELLVRFLYRNKLKYKYLPVDVMKMRTGGISTASLKSNLVLVKEDVKACKENGFYTNSFFILLKYVTKIWELLLTKDGGSHKIKPLIKN